MALTRQTDLDLLRIVDELETSGTVLLGDLSRSDLMSLAHRLGTVRAHRDSAADGVTTISPGLASPPTAGAAFTRAALPPHTDGSGVRDPADLVVGLCVAAPMSGGEALLCDGERVIQALCASSPESVMPLWDHTRFQFGAGRLRAPVLRPVGVPSERVALRFRSDSALVADSGGETAVRTLRSAIEQATSQVVLRPGDAYIVDNHRILHGRRAFSGDRTFIRLLINTPDLELGMRGVESLANTQAA